MELKLCSKCHVEKDINDFGKNRARPDGHQTFCKECARNQARESRRKSHSQMTTTPGLMTGTRITFPPES